LSADKPETSRPGDDEASESPADSTDADSTDADPQQASRRNFVRLAVRETMGTASQLAGLSGVVATTAAEAGRAMRESLEGLTGEEDRPRRSASANGPATIAAHPATGDADPTVLTPDTLPPQAGPLLSGVHAGVLATLVGDGSPFVTVGPVRYDGTAFVTTGRDMAAKVANVLRDPRVSLAITDDAGDTLLINGKARVDASDAAGEIARTLHASGGASLPEDFGAPDERGSIVIIVIDPLRAFWRPGGALP